MSLKTITIYKVYGCDDGGSPILYAEFFSKEDACSFAVANKGRIHYGLPKVEMHCYSYDPVKKTVSAQRERLDEKQVRSMAK